MIKLLGGVTHDGVAFSADQYRALRTFYEFRSSDSEVEASRKLHEEAYKKALAKYEKKVAEATKSGYRPREEPPRKEAFDEKSIRRFYEAGVQRDLMRETTTDGLRVMAFLAKFIQAEGQDPVQLVQELATEAGFDAGCWENGEDA